MCCVCFSVSVAYKSYLRYECFWKYANQSRGQQAEVVDEWADLGDWAYSRLQGLAGSIEPTSEL